MFRAFPLEKRGIQLAPALSRSMKYPTRLTPGMLAACLSLLHTTAQAQTVTSVSGTVANGQPITIDGSSFGAGGPRIVVFDDFEGGPVGQNIANHPATVGAWDNMVDSSPPR